MDYFTNDIKEGKISAVGKNAGGFLKPKAKLKVGGNAKSLLEGKNFEPISYEWMFGISKAKYQEQEGLPIIRISGQLSSIGKVGNRELEQGARNPACVWGWIYVCVCVCVGGRFVGITKALN